MNAYYIINTTHIEGARALAPTEGLPHQLLSERLSLDGTKTLIQCDISEELETYLSDNGAFLLGENINGRAEQSVLDYLQEHKAEWEAGEE